MSRTQIWQGMKVHLLWLTTPDTWRAVDLATGRIVFVPVSELKGVSKR